MRNMESPAKSKWPPGGPKLLMGSGKGVTLKLLGAIIHFECSSKGHNK